MQQGKREKEVETHQLRNRFGEEVVVTGEGIGERGFALEVEMREHFAIGQGLQEQLLPELFFFLFLYGIRCRCR